MLTHLTLPSGARVVALPKGGVLTHPSQASFEATAEAKARLHLTATEARRRAAVTNP